MAQTQLKLFFDLDGTLLDVSTRHYKVYSELVNKYGGKALSQPEYWNLKRHKATWPEIFEKSQLSLDLIPGFLNSFIAKIESLDYLKLDTLFVDAKTVLGSLAAQNCCYLVSLRRNHEHLLAELAWLKIDHYFKKILTGHSETDGYDKKIELISAELEEHDIATIIGDTEADIITGQQLGLKTVAVLSGIRDKEFLAGLQPTFIVDTIGQVLELDLQRT